MARDIALSPPVRPAKAAVGYPTPSTENASNGLQFSALVSPCSVIVGPTDFAVAEVLFYNRHLTNDEITIVKEYISKT